jgi:hypothetical protein
MAKKPPVDKNEPVVQKSMSLFEHINNVKNSKRDWKILSESDRKTWSTYMVNRFLSMNTDYIDLVNALQKYTISMDNGVVQKLYCELLPKDNRFSKYIKGTSEDKFSTELIDIVRKFYLCSSDEAIENIEMLQKVNPQQLITILKKYGKDDKTIKKILQ